MPRWARRPRGAGGVHECTGEVDPGLLAPGEFADLALLQATQAHGIQQLVSALGGSLLGLALQWPRGAQVQYGHELIFDPQGGQQVRLLEDDANVAAADRSEERRVGRSGA